MICANGIHSIHADGRRNSDVPQGSLPSFNEAERADILAAISADPEAGNLMPGTAGYRKRRFARAGTGKRGGARVVYLFGSPEYPIFLITAYAKSEKGNLTKAEQNALAKLAKSFFADYKEKS